MRKGESLRDGQMERGGEEGREIERWTDGDMATMGNKGKSLLPPLLLSQSSILFTDGGGREKTIVGRGSLREEQKR